MTGKVIDGHYYINEMIGRGGMADVYRAYDERLERDVAVKVIHGNLASGDPSFMARFEREAKSAAGMSSPNVVDIYDYGQFEGLAYIVMEMLVGQDLKSLIQENGPLPTDYTARIGAQVCNALSCAHRKGIVHRDVKPQNIMLVENGMVKLMDFGIARPQVSSLTVQDQVLGTAYYVSPEQAMGKHLDGASDQYSLGCVLYECATGRVPFEGDDPVSVAVKQIREAPRPMSELVAGIDPAFEAIVMKCLAKAPEDRFKSAEELGQVLSDYSSGYRVDIDAEAAFHNAQTQLIGNAQAPQGATMVMPGGGVSDTGSARVMYAGDDAKEREAADTVEKARKKKRNIIIGCVAGAVVLLAAIIAAVLLLGQPAPEEPEPAPEEPEIAMVSVPDFVGYTEEEARERAKEAGLEIRIRNEQSDDVPEGDVMDQNPDSGTQVEEGATIELVISAGEGAIAIPNIVGKTENEAYAALAAAGFSVGEVSEAASDTVPAGTVISQGATGNAQRGTSVSFTVSTGPETVQIPYVVGMKLTDAYAQLDGFNVRVSGSTDANSTVVSQDTGRVTVGGEVNITTQAPEKPGIGSGEGGNSSNAGGNSSGGDSGNENASNENAEDESGNEE